MGSPWILVKGENLLVREVSASLLLLALLMDQGQTNKSPNSIQQNRIRRLQLRISLGEQNQRDCEYIPHWILLELSANTLFAVTRRA